MAASDTSSLETGFSSFVRQHRESRQWSIAELARRARLTQPEVSRVESSARKPTLRLVRGIAEAFSEAPVGQGEPADYDAWISILVDLGERARKEIRDSQRTRETQ
jgi:transcriptional regulator with XRE-family HTH domain